MTLRPKLINNRRAVASFHPLPPTHVVPAGKKPTFKKTSPKKCNNAANRNTSKPRRVPSTKAPKITPGNTRTSSLRFKISHKARLISLPGGGVPIPGPHRPGAVSIRSCSSCHSLSLLLLQQAPQLKLKTAPIVIIGGGHNQARKPGSSSPRPVGARGKKVKTPRFARPTASTRFQKLTAKARAPAVFVDIPCAEWSANSSFSRSSTGPSSMSGTTTPDWEAGGGRRPRFFFNIDRPYGVWEFSLGPFKLG